MSSCCSTATGSEVGTCKNKRVTEGTKNVNTSMLSFVCLLLPSGTDRNPHLPSSNFRPKTEERRVQYKVMQKAKMFQDMQKTQSWLAHIQMSIPQLEKLWYTYREWERPKGLREVIRKCSQYWEEERDARTQLTHLGWWVYSIKERRG